MPATQDKSLLIMKIIVFFISGYCLLTGDCGKGPKLYFHDLLSKTHSVLENEFVNLTFWLNTSECEDPSGDYRMEVETRRIDGSKEYDGKFARINNLCSVTFQSSVRCIDDRGPAELFRKVNRSHAEIAVIWRWKDDVSGLLQVNETIIKLNVSYVNIVTAFNPSTATRHTENRSGVYLVKDNTEDVYNSESLILWIAMATAILLLAALTAICVGRRKRRNSTKLDTEDKTKIQRMLKSKFLVNLSYKDMLRLLHLEPAMKSKLSTYPGCESVSTNVREESTLLKEGESQIV